MDKEQDEIQFLGFFGIFKESFTLVSALKKIFFQITAVMIVPLSFIYLAHIEISDIIFTDILRDEYILDRIQEGTQTYDKISDVLSSEWTAFWFFKIAYFIFFLILALLSTSAVVYTIACIYTSKDISFKKVISVVPKVWKRLMVTFLWSFLILFAYNILTLSILVLWLIMMGPRGFGLFGALLLTLMYMAGFVYITVIYHLASVVSVLEDVHGLEAIIKSKGLIKGKLGISAIIFMLLNTLFFGIQTGFEYFVVLGYGGGFSGRVGYGIVFVLLLAILMLLGLTVQTIIYLICKSYHHENIDKSSLSDHLEDFHGEYVPLKSKDVQLESFHV
ncbi:uncharacterized protein LOC116020499 [Ipomoea triloba]|uniref:uncharacterized protein LOC116020499 n=1 Tax=Ipomoea triloba TaxID=35885 RepID=UPI00125E213B|nr:uncharacterized protein LOC116020499 [Ipomoea triloba]GMD49603.1 uncharacterized protein LOC109172467 [Ipomoea batatas]